MVLIRPIDIRKMNKEQRIRKLEEFKQKLFTVKSELASGGSIQSPSRIQEYKKAIAKILSIMTELDDI